METIVYKEGPSSMVVICHINETFKKQLRKIKNTN